MSEVAMIKIPATESESNSYHCNHFVKRKKRFCKMTVKKGFEYCGEHIPNTGEEKNGTDKTLRVVCPLDNKHTCFAHKLQKHLKICNAKPDNSIPYIVRGVNRGQVCPEESGAIMNSRLLSSVKPGDIKDLVARLNGIYDVHISENIHDNFRTNPIVEDEIKKPEYGEQKKKHLIQSSSLLGHLESSGLMKDETCYIEFGAGKGQLSYWISQAITGYKDASVLLVERASPRHKLDNKLDKSEGKVQRVKADIADLLLGKVEAVNKSKSIVGLTKHLCGDATDLALRCMTNFQSTGGVVSGVIMAFCCHHRCQWTEYTGKIFFEKNNLSRTDFDTMCGMVSWAVCGSGQSRDKCGRGNTDTNERDKEIGLSREEKEEVGKRCKHILDFARMKYLEKGGFSCSLHYYVSPSVSPENVCMVALRN